MSHSGLLSASKEAACRFAEEEDGRMSHSRTTLVFKNIPCRYSQEDVKRFIDESGFYGAFDLVYAPRSSAMQTNLGYAFVNFRAAAAAETCRNLLDGKPFGNTPVAKTSNVVFSYLQGGLKVLEASRRRKKLRTKAAPLIVEDGFPAEVSGGAIIGAAAKVEKVESFEFQKVESCELQKAHLQGRKSEARLR